MTRGRSHPATSGSVMVGGMRCRNTTRFPQVYDMQGHQVDPWAECPHDVQMVDPRTRALIDRGVLAIIPDPKPKPKPATVAEPVTAEEQPGPATRQRSRKSRKSEEDES